MADNVSSPRTSSWPGPGSLAISLIAPSGATVFALQGGSTGRAENLDREAGIRRAFAGETVVSTEHADECVLETYYAPVRDASGAVQQVVRVTIDITARSHWEEALRESEEKYRSSFEALQDVFYQTDSAGTIVLMSPSCLPHTGYTEQELLGTPVAQVFADMAELRQLLLMLRESDQVQDFEAHMVHKSGSEAIVSVNATVLRDADGRVRGFQGTLRDISDRKLVEAERDRIFTASVDMLAVADSRGRFLRVNPAWRATLGYEAAELVGQSLWHFIAREDRAEGILLVRRASAGEPIRDIRLRFVNKGGVYRWLSWNFADGVESGFTYCVVRDVTDLVAAQAAIEEALAAAHATSRMLEQQTLEMGRLRAEAEHQANHDVLTGAKNRRAWFADGVRLRPSAIAIFDIDRFKEINDAHGHPAGDEVLRTVAHAINAALPNVASFGRLGGEEFGAIWETPLAPAVADAERAIRAVEMLKVTLPGGRVIEVTVSAGLAAWRPARLSREAALAMAYDEADRALYVAKSAGRNRISLSPLTRIADAA